MRRAKAVKIITWIAAITGIVFMTALDSDSVIPMVVCGVCAVWCVLVCIANSSR
jgi:hypothetical protein